MLSWKGPSNPTPGPMQVCRAHHVPEIGVQMLLNPVRHGVVTTALGSLVPVPETGIFHPLCEKF